MQEYRGKSVYNGIAIGRAVLFKKNETMVRRTHIDSPRKECERFEEARQEALAQIAGLYQKALSEVGESGAMIFEVHQMMLEDEDYLEAIKHIIERQSVSAEYAVACTSDNFAAMFENMDDDYMKGRAADVRDISDRLIKILQGASEGSLMQDEPVIVLAEDLAPSETVQMDKSRVLSFVTKEGSANSHTAILARTMNIPALIQVKYDEEIDGKLAIVDGYEGVLYVEPDEELLAVYKEKQKSERQKQELLRELKGKENITRSGRRVDIFANIGNVSDAANALANDAGGIGLFRSEFLYLGKTDYPSEEEQFHAYRTVAETMAGKRVIIRTLDIGADKQADYFQLKKEENPAMGYRAIRICLDREDIFRTQLRAIFRASAYGNIWIMYPMIISVSEVRKIKEIAEQVKTELTAEGLAYGEVRQGIMVETPAAVMISDLLAKEVDFFSIGTNDLTQYTLAVDRQNEILDNVYDAHHEAVLRMIEMTVKNGHKENCYVGICGELAADLELTEWFLNTGVDELSVSPGFILPLRQRVRSLT